MTWRLPLAVAVVCLAAGSARAADPPVINMVVPLPPALAEEQKAPELICTKPTVPTGSRVAAAPVCKTAREWNELHAKGLDIAPDGRVAPMRKSSDVGACGLSCK